MTVEVLVAATSHRKQFKGQMIHIQDQPATWGNKEGLPNYVIVTITGTDKAQAMAYLETVCNVFDYSHVTAGGVHEVTVSVTPGRINLGGGFKQRARDYLVDEWGAVFTSWTQPNGPAVFEVPDTVDLQEMKGDCLDKLEAKLGRRFGFSSADVDTAIANGGTFQLTKGQAQSRIVDRLA